MITTTARVGGTNTSVHYHWGILTDLHLAAPDASVTHWHNTVNRSQSRELLRTALTRLAQHNVERLLLLGDLADEATKADYDYLLSELATTGLPAWPIPGNHDRPHDGRTQFDDAIAGHPNAQPPSAVAHLDRCIVLTGALKANPATQEDYEFILDIPPGRDGTLLIVLTHFPVLDLSETLREAGLKDAGNLRNREEIADSVTEWPGPVLVLHGHQHVRTHAIADNVLQLGFAALAEQPHDLASLDLTLEDRGPGGLGVDVRRHCSALHTPPLNWRRSLLDPEQTRFTWTPDGWQPIPEQRGE